MNLSFVGDWAPMGPCENRFDTDLAVANLECAFADGEIMSEKAYASVLPRSCMDNIPSGGFAALSVANNHVNDAGNFRETYAELMRCFPNIQFFGTVENPYAVFKSTNQESGSQTIVIGCLEPCRSRGNFIFRQEDVGGLIRKLRTNHQPPTTHYQLRIYVYPHWGKEGEYTRYPAPWQLKLARYWIDIGADGVFGSHSHVPQGREFYHGKPIYYSLGNFDFDHSESRLYEGTSDHLRVMVEESAGTCTEEFSSATVQRTVEEASSELTGWNNWRWARKVGPFNLKKNEASWRIRLKKDFFKTFPKYMVWQLLPRTLFFRIASLCR